MNTQKNIGHPGYYLFDGFYSTRRGLSEYTLLHKFDFASFIKNERLTEGTVVDLGCGNANFLADLVEIFPKLNVLGVDKKRYSTRLKPEQFALGDISMGTYMPSESVDLVVSTTVTPWIPGNAIESFYIEAHRIIKDTGYGIIFPIASNRNVQNKGNNFVEDLCFDKPVRTRKISPPPQLDKIAIASVQVLFGNSKLDNYFI